MNRHNWPFMTDLGDPNWTGRASRTMSHNVRDTRADERIPLGAWVGGAVFLAMVFGYIPLLWVLMT